MLRLLISSTVNFERPLFLLLALCEVADYCLFDCCYDQHVQLIVRVIHEFEHEGVKDVVRALLDHLE